PNPEMRYAGEQLLAPKYPNLFHSTNGSAEATTLAEASVDFVVAGQAFHWFDPVASHREFARILKRDGIVALVWNDRRIDDPLGADYQQLIFRYAKDHDVVRQRANEQTADESTAAFFGGEAARKIARFPNHQQFDFAGLRDRVLSSSYMPLPGDTK